MRDYPYVPETKREFIREKRREIKEARRILGDLRSGCALYKAFGGTGFRDAVLEIQSALQIMDDITKPLR